MRYFPDAVPGTIRKAFYFPVSVTARCWGQTSSAYKVLLEAPHSAARGLGPPVKTQRLSTLVTGSLFPSLGGLSAWKAPEVHEAFWSIIRRR